MTAWTRTHALTYGEKHCFIMWTQNDVVIAMLRKIYDYFSRFSLFFKGDSSFHELARDDTCFPGREVFSSFLGFAKKLLLVLLRKCQVSSDINFH